MIRVMSMSREGIVAARFTGSISTEQFAALPARICRESTTQARVLFDWRSLQHWSLENWSVSALRPWVSASSQLERIAIVHRFDWNRQAALIAALLRHENVLVRSWKTDSLDRAVGWLQSPAGDHRVTDRRGLSYNS